MQEEDIKKELLELRDDLNVTMKKLRALNRQNRSKIKQTQMILVGGFTAILLMVLNLNLKAEEMLAFIDKASDNYLKLAALVVGAGSGYAALKAQEHEEDDDEEDRNNS